MDAVGQALAALEQEERDLAARLDQIRSAVEVLRGMVAPTARRTSNGASRRGANSKGIRWLDQIYQVLSDARHPLHMKEIIDALERRGVPVRDRKGVRDIVSGAVTRQARAGKVFSHVAPGTFGLLEWEGAGRRSKRAGAKRKEPAGPPRPLSNTTAHLLHIVAENPGKTSGEIASLYSLLTGEDAETAKAKHNSRITRVGQLFKDGTLRREEGKYFIA